LNASLATAFTQAASPPQARHELRALWRGAIAPLAVSALLVAGWSALAPIDGAVVAPATVKSELNRKAVQHAEGGIVREIRVREGQAVRAGDVLLVVADLRTEATLALLRDQQRTARMRLARADAQARGAPTLAVPDALAGDGQAAEHIAREQAAFAARQRAQGDQVAQLQRQAGDNAAQAAALLAQIEATRGSAALSAEELAMNENLAAQGFVHRSRLIALQRIGTDYDARLAEHRVNLAAARQRGGEIAARIAELRLQAQAQAADEVREASAVLREIEQRLAPSHDQVERQSVRAPTDGRVIGLKVSAAGAAVAPRETLLDIVPSAEKLVFDVRIAPEAVEHVKAGGTAEVKLLGDRMRHAQPLPARVTDVAADRTPDAAGGPGWFAATVEVDAAALRAGSAPPLVPGMPAEVYVTTGARSALEYLLAPIDLFRRRALREP
jgi:HlyD family type I secretion membrane fusion protein